MNKFSSLDTLIGLATTATDDAAQKLGHAIRAGEEAHSKLALLLQYREDYAARFQASLAAGLTPVAYRNFQAFIDKLDTAISGQQQVVSDADKRIALERTTWQESERKRMSYGMLAHRAEKAVQHEENRRSQKMMDEHAARQAFYKR